MSRQCTRRFLLMFGSFLIALCFVAVTSDTHAQTEWTKYPSNANPQAVLDVGPSAWDSFNVNGPSVILDNGTYKMWYQGESGSWQIGYATSTNGTTWVKPLTTPVLPFGESGEWDDTHVQHPVFIYTAEGLRFGPWLS